MASVFSLLTHEPKALPKVSKVSITFIAECTSLLKKQVSSAKAEALKCKLLMGEEMPFIKLLALIFIRSVSITISYRKGAIGHPCLTDLKMSMTTDK